MRFITRVLVVVLLAAVWIQPVFAHGDHDQDVAPQDQIEQLTSVYGAIADQLTLIEKSDPNHLNKTNPYFSYGVDEWHSKESAFSNIIFLTLQAMEIEAHHECHADHEHGESCDTAALEGQLQEMKSELRRGLGGRLWDKLKKIGPWAKDIAIDTAGGAAEGFQRYGWFFAAYFVVTETLDHTVLDTIKFGVPLCPVLLGAYVVTVGTAQNWLSTACNTGEQRGILNRFWTATQATYFSYSFWWELRKIAVVGGDPVKRRTALRELAEHHQAFIHKYMGKSGYWGEAYMDLELREAGEPHWYQNHLNIYLRRDLDLIFSDESTENKSYVLTRHIQGFELLRKMIGDMVSLKRESGQLSISQYLALRTLLGRFSKATDEYQQILSGISYQENGTAFLNSKGPVLSYLNGLIDITQQWGRWMNARGAFSQPVKIGGMDANITVDESTLYLEGIDSRTRKLKQTLLDYKKSRGVDLPEYLVPDDSGMDCELHLLKRA